MKVLIIQENGHHDGNRGYRECFSFQRAFQEHANISADVWGNRHANFNSMPNFDSYDIIVQLEQYDGSYGQPWVPYTKIRNSKAYKILWAVDSHSRGAQYYEQLRDLGNFNLILNSIKHHVGTHGVWFPNAYDDMLIKPLRTEKKIDVAFCGNGGGGKREAILMYMQENLREKFKFDNWVIGDDMVKAINSYKIHFNFNVLDDINYRSFETIGTGTPLLTNYNYQYEELGFIHEKNCLIYKTHEEAVQLAKEYLNKPEKLKEIGDAGLELSRKHSYRARIRSLITYLKNKN